MPVAQALAADPAELAGRAERISGQLVAASIDAAALPSHAAVGGGGAPGQELDSAAVSLPSEFALPLRAGAPVRRGSMPAVVGRMEGGRLLLDLRAVDPADDELLQAAILAAAG